MVKVTAGALTKYKAIAEKAMSRVRAIKDKSEHVMEVGVKTTVTGTTAFALGVIQGKTGGVELGPIPLDLAVGAGAHLAGFMNLGGKNNSHLHAVGDGALAAYAVTMGRAFGVNWKNTGKLGLPARGAAVAGLEGLSGSDRLSDAELANAVLRR